MWETQESGSQPVSWNFPPGPPGVEQGSLWQVPGLLSFKHSGGCIAPARGSGRSPQAARHRSPRLKPAPECQAVCDSLWEPVPGEAACAPCCTCSRLMSARMAIVPGGQGAEDGGCPVSSGFMSSPGAGCESAWRRQVPRPLPAALCGWLARWLLMGSYKKASKIYFFF